MILKNKAWLATLGIALIILSMAVTAESFASTNRAVYIAGLATVILMAAACFFGDIFFYGVVDVRNDRWPRVAFVVLAMISATVIGLSAWKQTSSVMNLLRHFLPTFAVSALLLWYGSTALFSSFFFGKGVAVFMNNPAALIFVWRK